jgi:hypothetical protein
MDQQPLPDGDTNIGGRTLAVVLVMFAAVLLLYLPRMYTRLIPKRRLKAADYIVSLAVVSECDVGREIRMLITLR